MRGNYGKEASLIKMSRYDAANFSGTGIDDLLVYISQQVPIFTPMLLLFIFGVTFVTGVRLQKLREGRSDIPLWALLDHSWLL